MALSVRIGDPACLGDLVWALTHNGCVVQETSADSCLVIHVFAGQAEEARRELGFFVKAWQLSHPGVSALVTE